MRTFDTGATRDSEDDKFDYEGFLSPLALERFAAYMHEHRFQQDGSVRASDNWQKGIPKDAYIKSAWRHLMTWWRLHRGGGLSPLTPTGEKALEDTLAAIIFNAQGYLHEHLKTKFARPQYVVGKVEGVTSNPA